MGKLRISSKIPTIPLDFWDGLYKAEKQEWPSIVRKYELNAEQLNYVAANRVAVFERMRKMDEDFKSMSANTSKYYASKYGIKV